MVTPRLEVPLVRGEGRVLDLLEVDRLQPLPVHSGEKVEVVRMERTVAQLAHPVALELVEPVEPEVGVHEAAVPAELHERAQRVEPGQARRASQRTEAVAAARGRIGRRQRGLLLLEERRDVEPHVVVVIHTRYASSRLRAVSRNGDRAAGLAASAC